MPNSLTLTPSGPGGTITAGVAQSVVLPLLITQAGYEGILITGAPGQSGDYVRYQTSASSVLAKVDSSGVPHYYAGLQVGNDSDSNYGPNTGSPAGNVIPMKTQHLIGTAGTTTKQTTQAFVGWAKYKERTVDDSAEAASWGIILTSAYGGFASAQTLPVVGFEGDALIQGTVSVTNKVIGITAAARIQDTAHADSTMNFYSAQTQCATGATITSRYGFYDEGITGTGAITNNWSFYGKFDIQTEKKMYVGLSGVPATQTQHVLMVGTSADTTGTLAVQVGSGQTSASIQVRDSGGTQRGQWFGASGNIHIGNAATSGSGVGLISIVTSTAPSGTPVANGFYFYVDPADGKLKAKGNSGTVTILAVP